MMIAKIATYLDYFGFERATLIREGRIVIQMANRRIVGDGGGGVATLPQSALQAKIIIKCMEPTTPK